MYRKGKGCQGTISVILSMAVPNSSTSMPPIPTLHRPPRVRTRPGRLAALDAWLVNMEPSWQEWQGEGAEVGVFVDLGLGRQPWTTLESAAALAPLAPSLRVVGVDMDEDCVRAAAAHAGPGLHFRRGGFHLPLLPEERALVVRAMNVLRQYPAAAVPAAHAALGDALLPGGLLLEGSSDRDGGVLVAHLLRQTPQGLHREALLFYTDFSRGFAPILFRDWLPRDLRHRVRPGEPIHTFFATWTAAWERVRGRGLRAPPTAFAASIQEAAAGLPGLCLLPWALRHGYCCWAPPSGVPLPRS